MDYYCQCLSRSGELDTYTRVASPTRPVLPYDGYRHFHAHLLEESTFKRTYIVVCRIVKLITNDGGKEEDEPRPEGSSLTSNIL